ncbi:MAG: hypothetical protein IKF14_02375 [Atopobiaceae bacterium]|nr:hypothetical protein [Atopobiaceae bacterium]
MVIDWKRTDVTHTLSAVMVSQTNFAQTMGAIEGVEWAASSLEAAYYTDMRTGGKLRVHGDGWKRGSFIRIVHGVPEFNYSKTLGTYVVTDEAPQRVGGEWVHDLTLSSTLVMLANDLFTKPVPIDKGTRALDAMKSVLSKSGAASMRSAFGNFSGADATSRVAIDDSLADDVKATKAQVLEAGKSILEAFFALANMSQNRIDVAPEGYIRVSRHARLASRAASWTFDLEDARGTVLAGSLSRSSDWLSMPDTVAVQHDFTVETNGKTQQRTSYAIARNASGPHSIATRGYSIVDFRQVPNISPHTLQAASDYAARALKSDVEQVEWELQTTYIPLWEGDVVNLVVHDGDAAYRGTRKCLVKNVDIQLGTMLTSLTLKETASGDEE